MIKVKNISLQNICGLTFDFEIPQNRKIIEFRGPTGCGKTLALEAPLFALYNYSFYRRRTLYPLINSEGNIEVTFANDKEEISIKRSKEKFSEGDTEIRKQRFWNKEFVESDIFEQLILESFGDMESFKLNFIPQGEDFLFTSSPEEQKQILSNFLLDPQLREICDKICLKSKGEIDKIEAKIEDLKNRREEMKSELKRLAEMESDPQVIREKIHDLNESLEPLREDQIKLEQKVKAVQDRIKDKEDEKEIAQLQTGLELIRNAYAKNNSSIQSIKESISAQKEQLSEINDERKSAKLYHKAYDQSGKKIGELERNEISVFWLINRGFSEFGVLNQLLVRDLNVLQSVINHYLQLAGDIFSSSDIFSPSLGLKIEGEMLSIRFSSKGRRPFPFRDLSFGEKKIVELAFRAGILTFNMIRGKSKIGFCIFEEPFLGIDSALRSSVIRILKQLSDFVPQIFISTALEATSIRPSIPFSEGISVA